MSDLIAFDPGLSGAWAILTGEDGYLIACGDIPTHGEGTKRKVNGALLADTIRGHLPSRAVVELVGAMPGQGVSSMFRFGEAYGTIQGVLATVGIPTTFYTPSQWKRASGLLGSDKETARQRAIQLFPAHASLFARKKDHQRAEAALLGLYALRRAQEAA